MVLGIMDRIIVWGYWVKNLGDDLFLKSLINVVDSKRDIIICTNKE